MKAGKKKAGAPAGNKNAIGNDGGRPTKYKKEYADQAHELAMLGMTEKELAEYFDISVSTLNLWKKDHIEFMDALRRGRVVADAKVATSLYRRAIGIQVEEITYEAPVSDKSLNIKKPVYRKKVVVRDLPPDVGAATMWLKNRQRHLWRDKDLDLSALTDEQLDYIIQQLKPAFNKPNKLEAA